MNQPTIRVSPSELPKFNFLQYRNYLGEFKTEIDKARVRYNLGIPDSLSFKWGNIGGTIENQQDLIQLVRQTVNNQFSQLSQTVDGLVNKTNTIGDNILTINNDRNSIQIANDDYKQSIEQRLFSIEREVSQNAALINTLSGNGTIIDFDSITSQINSLRDRIIALENNPTTGGGNYDLAISNLQNQINTLSGSLSQINSRIANLEASIGIINLESISVNRSSVSGTLSSDKASIIVTATFSNGSTRNVTSECSVESSNTTVATWNNGIQFVGAGTAIITFTYTNNGITLNDTVNVSVTQSTVETAYFLGYGTIQNLLNGNILGNTDCLIRTPNTTIERTGENIFKYQGIDLGGGSLSSGTKLFFCCPSNRTLSEWNENSNNTGYESLAYDTYTMSLGNETYNIYYISPLTYDGFVYQFKVN